MTSIVTCERPRAGFALVIVLVILSLMTIIAVGYLSSMSAERATANAFSNKARAEQAAQAGVDSAEGILRDYFKAFPDSVTAWDTTQSTNAAPASGTAPPPNEGTTLYLRAMPLANDANTPDPVPGISNSSFSTNANYAGGNNPNNVDASTGVDNRQIFALPLISGATVKPLGSKANTVPTLTTDTPTALGNAVNLNNRRQLGDAQGWLGSPPGYVNPSNSGGAFLPKPFNVPWVEITQKDSFAPGAAAAPVVGRYAFWVEDESFRANISDADQGQEAAHPRRDNNVNVALNSSDANLLGLLNFFPDANAATDRQNLITTRSAYPGALFPESRGFAHTSGLTQDIVNDLRYVTTAQSAALNLSRHGTQRLNLNAVMDPSPVPTDTATIQTQFDKIVDTIQFHAPNFGQRFYRASAAVQPTTAGGPNELNGNYVTPLYSKIYLAKIAANIRDYIDTDNFPTCILPADATNLNGKVATPAPPTLPIGDISPGPAWALGKDGLPFMQECAAHYTGSVSGTGAASTYNLTTDYYIEVWNMSNKDIHVSDLGPNAYIRVGNPTKWVGSQTSNFQTQIDPLPAAPGTISPSDTRKALTVPPSPGNRDFNIDISAAAYPGNSVLFPAGMCTVVTTDPNWTTIITDTEAKKHVLLPISAFKSPGTRTYTGSMPVAVPASGSTPAVYCNAILMQLPSSTLNTGSDFDTDIVIGSDWGHIDSLGGALTISWGGRITFPHTNSPPNIFGGYLRGNWTNTASATSEGLQPSALGDPRTNNEQLYYDPSSTSTSDKTRYTNYAVGNAKGVFPTLGLPNWQSVHANRLENPWPDFPPLDPANNILSAATAPAVIADAPLTSIGQLGDVFDPARIYTTYSGASVTSSRGGGRTFKIGQHDDRWDGDQASASRGWTSWRLADFFCTADAVSQPGFVDVNGVTQPGLFNINGILRDNGAALSAALHAGGPLRAALNGFRFQPASAPGNPTGDPKLADATDTTQPSKLQIDALVKQIADRLKAPPTSNGRPNTGTSQTGIGPFWERGELSELPLFGRTPDTTPAGIPPYTTTDLAGVDMSSVVFDRGREELVRRLIEMITTRGSVFTVYAVGQSITQSNANDPKSKHITGTHQLKVTFRLVPKNKPDPTTGIASDFHPGTNPATGKSLDGGSTLNLNDSAQLNARFAKPDHYDVQTIYASSGNS